MYSSVRMESARSLILEMLRSFIDKQKGRCLSLCRARLTGWHLRSFAEDNMVEVLTSGVLAVLSLRWQLPSLPGTRRISNIIQ